MTALQSIVLVVIIVLEGLLEGLLDGLFSKLGQLTRGIGSVSEIVG